MVDLDFTKNDGVSVIFTDHSSKKQEENTMIVEPDKASSTNAAAATDHALLRSFSLFFYRKLTEKNFRPDPILPEESAASQCAINWLVRDTNNGVVAVTLRAAPVNGRFGPSLLKDLDLFQQTVAAPCLFVGISAIPAAYLEELTARHVAAYHYPTTGALEILRCIEDLLASLKRKHEKD